MSPVTLVTKKGITVRAALYFGLMTLLFPAAAFAQIGATQGVPTVKEGPAEFQTQFHSPMVLTVPFPITDRGQWGSGKWSDPLVFQQLRDYRCDGIAISQMQMRGKLQNDGTLEVQVKGKFDALKGHDKRVDMKFEFLNGDILAAAGYSEPLKAPDEKVAGFKFKLIIPAAALQSQPPTHLRITFSDYDD